MKAVILAGGLGTRLQPYTTFIPKPMLPLGEKPLLEHLIEWVKKNGINARKRENRLVTGAKTEWPKSDQKTHEP